MFISKLCESVEGELFIAFLHDAYLKQAGRTWIGQGENEQIPKLNLGFKTKNYS